MSGRFTDQQYILANISVREDTGCWEWALSRHPAGYGISRRGSPGGCRAHRLAYAAFVGPLLDGMYICHRCDNPPCVNPEHLFQGTPSQNSLDREYKGRRNIKGEINGRAKLKAADIPIIRKCLQSGESQQSIASRYGVSQVTISKIKLRPAWSHITDDEES